MIRLSLTSPAFADLHGTIGESAKPIVELYCQRAYGDAALCAISNSFDLVYDLRKLGEEVVVDHAVKLAYYQSAQIDEATVQRVAKSGLFSLQKSDCLWLCNKPKALLRSEMGTGKTPVSLVALPEQARAIVVCPSSLKGNWRKEAKAWRQDLTTVVLDGKESFRWPIAGEIVILNYEILPNVIPKDSLGTPVYLLADEAHYLKTAKAIRTKRFRKLSSVIRKCKGSVWLLTGTPLLNDPLELWTVLRAADIAEAAFNSWPNYVRLFHGYQNEWRAWVWSKPNPIVRQLLRRISIRRTRKELMPELPDKIYRRLDTTIDESTKMACSAVLNQLQEVDADVETAIEKTIKFAKSAPGFQQLSEARRMLGIAKIPYAVSLMSTFEEAQEPVVVFAVHVDVVTAIGHRMGWKMIYGDIPPNDRQQIVDEFQEGKLKGLAITIDTGGTGFTLTRSHQVVFVELDWTPAMNVQAEDRLCRIGQTKGVIVSRIVSDHILDKHLHRVLTRKQSIIEGI